MPDLAHAGLALTAGSFASIGVTVALFDLPRSAVDGLGSRAEATSGTGLVPAPIVSWFSGLIDRAGWNETPGRALFVVLGLAAGLGAVSGAIDLWLAPAGFAVGAGFGVLVLASSAERRRRRLAAELVPLLELFTLELSGGGSALSALGSVSLQVEGELAAELRRMLVASQVKGSPSLEAGLLGYAERIRIPALATLATTLGADRDFGTGASQGVRALATDLRRAQRRDLIAHSRKALNHVLLPAAVGVLLPFLGVLMFPAVSVLQRSLR